MEENIVLIDDLSIRDKIHTIRGVRVMLDFDLAEIYGYSTSAFNQQVKRNTDKFPEDFKECIKQNNYGYPENKFFYSWKGKCKRKRVFNYLFSFNKDDITSIWNYNNWRERFSDWVKYSNGEIENYVVFAGDAFGNLIGYDKRNNGIVFIDHEQLGSGVEKISDSFTELMNSLKSK